MLLGTEGQVSNHDSSICIQIQLLYYVKVGGERKHIDVRVMGWKAALLQRGEQAINKERDIRDTRSDAHVLSSGPTQA